MKTEDIINILKIKEYPFELKENQIIIRVARRYCLKLYIESDNIVKDEDVVKRFSLWTNGKKLKAAFKIDMISFSILTLPLVLWCILDPYFFFAGGKYFFIATAPVILSQLVEFWYYNNRLSKIKKLLNLNDLPAT